jgi:hypothetical protein
MDDAWVSKCLSSSRSGCLDKFVLVVINVLECLTRQTRRQKKHIGEEKKLNRESSFRIIIIYDFRIFFGSFVLLFFFGPPSSLKPFLFHFRVDTGKDQTKKYFKIADSPKPSVNHLRQTCRL